MARRNGTALLTPDHSAEHMGCRQTSISSYLTERNVMDQELEQFLANARDRPDHDRVTLSIRELLAHWGVKRRGYWVAHEIERDLREAGLVTNPSFTEGWIDNTVTLIPVNRTINSGGSDFSVNLVEAADRSLPDVALRVSSLPSANRKVAAVAPDGSLEQAQSLMMCHDYSQLAVVSDTRNLRGAVSWESIAQAKIRDPQVELRRATVPAETVRSNDDLLAQIPRVMEAGFVFILAEDRRINGIVTTADLSQQFADLAKPFFVLAEIERRSGRGGGVVSAAGAGAGTPRLI